MRTVINFTVRGSNRADLDKQAIEVYRDLMSDPEAELPYSATMEVRPDTIAESGSGEVVARTWEGEITVSLAADGAGK